MKLLKKLLKWTAIAMAATVALGVAAVALDDRTPEQKEADRQARAEQQAVRDAERAIQKQERELRDMVFGLCDQMEDKHEEIWDEAHSALLKEKDMLKEQMIMAGYNEMQIDLAMDKHSDKRYDAYVKFHNASDAELDKCKQEAKVTYNVMLEESRKQRAAQ